MIRVEAIAGAVLILALVGCTGEGPGPEAVAIQAPGAGSQEVLTVLPGDEEVLARVSGSPITRFDLEQAMDRMLGPDQAALLDEGGHRKVLESLVMSRAMAQAMERDLDAEAKARLDRQAAAYREELLVKLYLTEHTDPQPVTQEMVKAYYESHPERFGGRVIRRYESIAATGRPQGEALRRTLEVLGEARLEGDWPAEAKYMETQGLAVRYGTGQVDERLLQPRVRDVMKGLQVGEASRSFLVDGTPQVVRIIDEDTRPPRPLSEVSGEIRRALAPIQLKEAVKAASAELMKTIDVQYQEASGS